MASIQLNGGKQNFILDKKDFKTGSRGYYAPGKMMAAGKKYQIGIQVVEIGSKPKQKKEKEKVKNSFSYFSLLFQKKKFLRHD